MTLQSLLVGDRLRLNALRDADIPLLTAWYQDQNFLRNLDAIPVGLRSESSVREMIEGLMKRPTRDYGFAIRKKDTDELIGLTILDGILWNNGTCHVSIEIGEPSHRSRGYGREAMELVLDFAFQELNLHAVSLTVFSYNEPAIRLYEKLGFTKEGVRREYLHRDGKRHDLYLYGMLRREWEAR